MAQRLASFARNPRVMTALKVLVTVAILFMLFRSIDVKFVLQRLAKVDPLLLALAAVIGAAQGILVMSWRWGIVLRLLGKAVAWRRLAHFMTVSLFFNELMPSTIGGDTMRVVMLRRIGGSIAQAAKSVVVERALGLTSLLVLAIFGAAALLPFASEPMPLWIIIAAASAALVFATLLILFTRLGLRLPGGIVQRIAQSLNETVDALRRVPGRLMALIGLSFVGQFFIFVTVWLVALALHVPLGLWQVVAVMPAIILVASVPVTLAEWGVREGAMVVGLGLVGVPATDAVTVSLVYGLLFLVLGMLSGVVWVFSRKLAAVPDTPGPIVIEPTAQPLSENCPPLRRPLSHGRVGP